MEDKDKVVVVVGNECEVLGYDGQRRAYVQEAICLTAGCEYEVKTHSKDVTRCTVPGVM